MANVFLKIFGKSNNMKVFDYLLDVSTVDVSITDILEGTELSRKTVEKILKNYLDEGLVLETRIVGKSKLYKINEENPICKKLMQINKIVLDRQESKLALPSLD